MAALGAASLGAAVSIGTAIYNDEKGFGARHEQSYDAQSALTQRLVEAFSKAYKEGDLAEEDHELYMTLKDEAVEAAKEYHKMISEFKQIPRYHLARKLGKKKKVREHKRILRDANGELQSHYSNSLSSSASDASSITATSGSPPGSGLEDESIREWSYNVEDDHPESTMSDPWTEGVSPPEYFNATPISCRTCECHIPHGYFEKHRHFCLSMRRLADEIITSNDEISEFRNTFINLRKSPILDQINDFLQIALETGIYQTSQEDSHPPELWQVLAKLDGIPITLELAKPDTEDTALIELAENAERIVDRKMEHTTHIRKILRSSNLPWRTWQKGVREGDNTNKDSDYDAIPLVDFRVTWPSMASPQPKGDNGAVKLPPTKAPQLDVGTTPVVHRSIKQDLPYEALMVFLVVLSLVLGSR